MPISTLLVAFTALQQSLDFSRDASGRVTGYSPTKQMIDAATQFKGDAPPIEGTDSTGKPLKLTDFGKMPAIVVFIDRDCPYAKSAKSYFDQIQFMYQSEANVIGVIDANQEDAGEWVEAAVPKFRLILDPDLKITKSYGATRSLHTVLISTEHKVLKAWPGYSGGMLQEITGLLAKQPGVHRHDFIRFINAPTALSCGNPLTPQDKKN